jgi:hypothetical protein
MKNSFTLLLIFVSITAFCQTHFITAGQTQGMIFTDYVPDEYFFSPGTFNHTETKAFDLNNDGTSDLNFYFGHLGIPSDGVINFSIQPLQPEVQTLCFAYSGSSLCDSNLRVAIKIFQNGDTITNSNTLWSESLTYILKDTGYAHSEICFWGTDVFSSYSSYYCAGRFVTNIDTTLYYIHIRSNGSDSVTIADYAIEGQDTTYVISSTNDLSPSNTSAYPNPFTNQINISTGKPFEYQLTDYTGRVVLSGKAEHTIATDELVRGCYLLAIKNEETFSVKKMVKQ